MENQFDNVRQTHHTDFDNMGAQPTFCTRQQKREYDADVLGEPTPCQLYKCVKCKNYYRAELCERYKPLRLICICYGCEQMRCDEIDHITMKYPQKLPLVAYDQEDRDQLEKFSRRVYFPDFYPAQQ